MGYLSTVATRATKAPNRLVNYRQKHSLIISFDLSYKTDRGSIHSSKGKVRHIKKKKKF